MTEAVVRRWEARAPMTAVEAWLAQFHDRVMPNYWVAEGFRWVKVLVSRGEDPRQVTVLTAWDDMDAVKRFAGPHSETAVMPEWVANLMPDHDDLATHFHEVMSEANQ